MVLAHMGGADLRSWGELPGLLKSAGFAVLAFDFRGHGDSAGELDPPMAATDLAAALDHLRAVPLVDEARIGLVGASMGGMASVIVAADDPDVRAVAVVSTSPEAAGQFPGRVVAQLSPRPFLAIGCSEDPITRPERVRQLFDAAGEPKRLEMLSCDAHGNDILGTAAGPQLVALILEWLDVHLTG